MSAAFSPILTTSVPDPDPNPEPPDPHVFRPPGSGSASQIYGSGSRSFLSSSKNSKKTLDSYCFVTSFGPLSLKNEKLISRKTFFQKISFLLASKRSMTKIAGSGSISQKHGSADPDPHQNIMDPEHCLEHNKCVEVKCK